MSNKLAFILGLGIGAAAGIGVSWRILKTHYKKIADEEIENVKEWFYSKETEKSEVKESVESEETPEERQRLRTDYSNIIQKHYDKTGVSTVTTTHPYTISPDDYGEKDDYETKTLSWYSGDGVLADYVTDEIIEDIDNTVGSDSLTTFGQYEDNAVFVRNDATLTDYEILLENGNYADTKKPICSSGDED